MPDIPNTTRAQTRFLRALKKNPHDLPAELWPSPTYLRRWLRKEGFRKALSELRDALYFESDLHLARASALAAHELHSAVPAAPDVRTLLGTIRLSHQRQLAAATARAAEPEPIRDPGVPTHLLDELEQIQRKTLRTHFTTALAEIGLPLPPDPRDLPAPSSTQSSVPSTQS